MTRHVKDREVGLRKRKHLVGNGRSALYPEELFADPDALADHRRQQTDVDRALAQTKHSHSRHHHHRKRK
jgi:hypothetical protein